MRTGRIPLPALGAAFLAVCVTLGSSDIRAQADAPGANAPDAIAAPEIARDPLPPQAAGAAHTLRIIPEACVWLEGRFAPDTDPAYTVVSLPRRPCRPRARFIDAAEAVDEAGVAWILNDRFVVPRADSSGCVAIVELWRDPGVLSAIELDAQQRARMYLSESKPAAGTRPPRYRVQVSVPESCGPA